MAVFLGKYTLLSAVSAQDTVAALPTDLVNKAIGVSIYAVYGAGVASGVVVLEGAHDPAYAGTWATIATLAWSAANKVVNAAVVGNHAALRVRVSTVLAGGTVDVYAVITG